MNGDEKKSPTTWQQVSERVRDRAKSKFVIGVLPDPVTNYERFGVNFDDLAPLTDEFLVVMFSKNYATPWYWEMLTRNFKKLFKDVKLNIALYVIGPGDDPRETPTPSELLTVSVRMARAGVDGLLYLTDKAAQMVEFQKACNSPKRHSRTPKELRRQSRPRSSRLSYKLGKDRRISLKQINCRHRVVKNHQAALFYIKLSICYFY